MPTIAGVSWRSSRAHQVIGLSPTPPLRGTRSPKPSAHGSTFIASVLAGARDSLFDRSEATSPNVGEFFSAIGLQTTCDARKQVERITADRFNLLRRQSGLIEQRIDVGVHRCVRGARY